MSLAKAAPRTISSIVAVDAGRRARNGPDGGALVAGSRQAWAVGGSYLGKRLILDNVLRYRR